MRRARGAQTKDTYEMDSGEKLEYAEKMKNRGNSSFRRNDWTRAYKYYDKARRRSRRAQRRAGRGAAASV